MTEKNPAKRERIKWLLIVSLILVPAYIVTEFALRYYPDNTCVLFLGVLFMAIIIAAAVVFLIIAIKM